MELLRYLHIFLILSFSFYSVDTEGQQFYSENINIQKGLPDNAIRSIFKDSRGYYWIGTEAGVSKWNGENFITYNSLNGLAGNNVWCIDEDEKGNLWFACFGGGISYFDGRTFRSYTMEDGLPDNLIRKVKWDPYRDCLLIGTSRAISVLKDSVFHNFTSENGNLRRQVIITSILCDSSKALFLDFSKCGQKMTFDRDSAPKLTELKDTWLNDYGISSAHAIENNDTIIGWHRKGVVIKSNDKIKEFDSIGQVFNVAADEFGNYWIASWNGGAGLSPPGGLFKLKNNTSVYLNEAYDIGSIVGWEMHYDNAQQLAFYGTLDEGLYRIPPPVFEYYTAKFFQEDKLGIVDFEIDHENNFWFITDSLFFIWDGKDLKKLDPGYFYDIRIEREKSLTTADSTNDRISELQSYFEKRELLFNEIEFDNKKNVWLSVFRLGLYKLDRGILSKIKNFPYGIVKFKFDENDTVFAADRWSKNLRKYPNFEKNGKHVIIKDSNYSFYPRKFIQYNNETWLCSRYEGVFLYKDGLLRVLTDEDTSINKLVSDICFDEEGYAYLGGRDGRVEILLPGSRKKFFEFHESDFNQSVEWLKISNSMLFVGYNTCMLVIPISGVKNKNFKNKNFKNKYFYGRNEGYPDFHVNTSRVDQEGNIWLATVNGLVKINMEYILNQKAKPLKTTIKKIELFNEPTDWSKFVSTNPWYKTPTAQVALNAKQNHLSIYYQTLNYNDPSNEDYYYMLEGADQKWQGPTDKRYVVYPYLQPGTYTFKAKSKNRHSNLFTDEASFEFVILTPWYKQWWFIVVLTAVVIALFLLGFHMRLNIVRRSEARKREILTKITELETKALQAQMNPHFIFNSMNSIQNYVLGNDVDDALVYLNSFSKIIRMTLDFVDKKYVTLSDEINYLRYYTQLENMRFNEIFDFEVNIDESIDPDATLIPPMLLQPIIENSIKHGIMLLKERKGQISVNIKKIDERRFECVIEDNGIGIKESEKLKEHKIEQTSRGLKITRERLKMLLQDQYDDNALNLEAIFDESGNPAGSRIIMTLPFILN